MRLVLALRKRHRWGPILGAEGGFSGVYLHVVLYCGACLVDGWEIVGPSNCKMLIWVSPGDVSTSISSCGEVERRCGSCVICQSNLARMLVIYPRPPGRG